MGEQAGFLLTRVCPWRSHGLAAQAELANSNKRRASYGNFATADHQRSGAGQHVCPDRAGLHHGVRHHQPDQFRARRGADGRRADQLDHHRLDAGSHARHARLADSADCPADRLRGVRRAELHHRKSRLPAAAQLAQAGAADHRHRHVAAAADAGHDHLEAQLQALPDPAAVRAVRDRRRRDHRDADVHSGRHGGFAGGADVAGATTPSWAAPCAPPPKTRASPR